MVLSGPVTRVFRLDRTGAVLNSVLEKRVTKEQNLFSLVGFFTSLVHGEDGLRYGNMSVYRTWMKKVEGVVNRLLPFCF